jgi:hypothetical protein
MFLYQARGGVTAQAPRKPKTQPRHTSSKGGQGSARCLKATNGANTKSRFKTYSYLVVTPVSNQLTKMTAFTLQEQIRSASAQQARLLNTLSETDYAVSACQQSTNYINTLKKQIAAEEARLQELGKKVTCEYADHKKYRDSHIRRMAYKIGGKEEKFNEKATKEEKEWLDAVQAQLQCKQNLEHINSSLADAIRTNNELSSVSAIHNAAGVEMDELYNSIFEGPTPDLPEEDAVENQVQQAKREFDIVQLMLSTETQTMSILKDAEKFLVRAIGDLGQALRSNSADMFGGGTWAEYAENSALSRAQSHVFQVRMLISQAQRIHPEVTHLGGMQIAQMNGMDFYFDNIFTEWDMMGKIENSQRQLRDAERKLHAQIQAGVDRQRNAQSELDVKKTILLSKREELQKVRTAAFERIAAGMPVSEEVPPVYAEPPPSYTR